MEAKETLEWLRAAYDKLILSCVLLGLLMSFVLLYVLVDREKLILAAARSAGPSGPRLPAGAVDTALLKQTMKQLKEPFQISDWTNRMMVAELRVSCVACGRPIPYNAETCPFRNCAAPQPGIRPDDRKDSDLDGVPDKWEKEHGLNPMNPDDAQKDADADGFTNREEFNFETDPLSDKSAPSPAAKLRVLKIGRLPMPLSFQAVSRMTGGDTVFTLKHRPTGRDYYAKMGQIIDGYEIVGYVQKTNQVVKPGIPEPIMENASLLTVRKNGKNVDLPIFKQDNLGELAAKLLFLMDNSEFLVTVGDALPLKKNSYRVVDINQDVVIVKDVESGKEVSVEFQAEDKR